MFIKYVSKNPLSKTVFSIYRILFDIFLFFFPQLHLHTNKIQMSEKTILENQNNFPLK